MLPRRATEEFTGNAGKDHVGPTPTGSQGLEGLVELPQRREFKFYYEKKIQIKCCNKVGLDLV